jgi:hypothetical protein
MADKTTKSEAEWRSALTPEQYRVGGASALESRAMDRSSYRRDRRSGYAVLRGEKAPDDALARELGAMGLL